MMIALAAKFLQKPFIARYPISRDSNHLQKKIIDRENTVRYNI